MSRLISLLLLLLLATSHTSAQSSSSPSSPLYKLRGKLAASSHSATTPSRAPAAISHLSPVQHVAAVSSASDEDTPIGVASVRPFRTAEELAADTPVVGSSAVEEEEAQAGAASDASDVWTGQQASILPYRETDGEEQREAAEEAEESVFAVASILPFDGASEVDSEHSGDVAVSEAAVSSAADARESESAKRSRVRRFRLRRWLLQKKLGTSVIYSD